MRFKIVTLIIFFSAIHFSNAQSFWEKIDKNNSLQQKTAVYERENLPDTFKVFSLNNALFLNAAVDKSTSKKIVIDLPNEKGELLQFSIQETSNFEEGLSAKFPSIKTFTAKAVNDASINARISLGVDGFHAVIYSLGKSTVYIDPYSKDNKQYMVYSKNDLLSTNKNFVCATEEFLKKEAFDLSSLNKNANDGLLRTYRIAIACTGEYAQFHLERQNISSTATDQVKKATVLSAINTSLTRINEIFERDLSVKLMLVANNDEVVFLDANTDGLTNDDVEDLIGENQVICDREIGNTNYDVGHVLASGNDNGLAGLGVVCLSGQKARGVTARVSPVGDTFDIDFVAHELGHQFGATHTQNNDCQRTSSTAVEPGSGSTIMSYAGICSPNVQGQVDDHFHAVSIAQMWSVINSSATCATTSNTNNTAPTANAGNNYSIPKSTPFVLKGTANDAEDINTLTYNWEQIDNGIATMPPASTNSVGPLFRSLPSKTSSDRYFPDLTTVVNGTTDTWQVLPSVARDLNFALTIRDNNINGGATARDDVFISVTDAITFTVTQPNTAVTWDVGSTQMITWNVGTTDQNPINCVNVNLKLSIDGGVTFPITIKSNTPNDGSEVIVVPNNVSENARIMVEAADNIFYNVNNTGFTINSTIPTFVFTNENDTTQFACDTGNETVSFIFNLDFVNDFSENISFTTSGEPENSTVLFTPSILSEEGNVTMTIGNLNDAILQEYTINVVATSASITQNLNVNLQITDSSLSTISLTSPINEAIDVPIGQGFIWEADTNASSYNIEITTDDSFNFILIQDNAKTNSYLATSLQKGVAYFWRIKPINTCTEGSFSETFSFTTEICEICESVANNEFDTSTTLVNFNTISNETLTKTSGYSDFTSMNTIVERETTYDLTVHVNTADDSNGEYTTNTYVWIDWNQNCDFTDEGEEYNLGTAFSTTNGATSLSPLSITVPTNAISGTTIMRVSTKFADDGIPTSCENNADGEVEDYSIAIDSIAIINDETFKNFNLFPNPSTNKGEITLYLDVENREEDLIIQLFDFRGKLIREEKYQNLGFAFARTLFFEQITTGLYLLKITNGDKFTTRKVLFE